MLHKATHPFKRRPQRRRELRCCHEPAGHGGPTASGPPPMIDQYLVGALVRGDLSGYHFNAEDVRLILANRVGIDVHHLLEQGSGEATDEARQMLAAAHRTAMMRSITLAATANRVTQILAEAGVDALVYKGVALAIELRGELRGPHSADVDVLIAPESVDAAHAALTAAGLSRRDGEAGPPSRLHRLRAIESEYVGLPATIDLHWHVESPGYFAIPFEEMWRRRQRMATDNMAIWAPSTAETLLITATHGTREAWRSLRHVLNFAKLAVMIDGADWALTEELSARGPRRSLAVALGVAKACGVQGLPARPGPWARKVAAEYLAPVAAALREQQPPGTVIGRTPTDAIRRRLLRWRIAPDWTVATDALLRSGLRQGGTDKRSWRLGAP